MQLVQCYCSFSSTKNILLVTDGVCTMANIRKTLLPFLGIRSFLYLSDEQQQKKNKKNKT